jgi:hypothetical protein
LVVRVRHLDGQTCDISRARIGDFVTEAGNPKNRRQVAVVDVFTPTMAGWPGIRVVDTPGLGSVYAHNTEATRAWMPNVAVALVTVSAERPLSDEDRRPCRTRTGPHRPQRGRLTCNQRKEGGVPT